MDFHFTIFWLIVFLIYYFVIIAISVSIVLENRNPLKTIAYVIVLNLLPVIGLIIYIFFGQNIRKQKLFSRKEITDSKQIKKWMKAQLIKYSRLEEITNTYLLEKAKIARMLMNNDKTLLTINNRVEVLTNGENTFPAILKALDEAQHHIHFEYYIIEDDGVGEMFIETFIKKAKQGVKIRIMYDYVGSNSFRKGAAIKLKNAGVEIFAFMPVRFPHFTGKANYRNHRKIIVVDGQIGFTGGLNIAERYMNKPGKLLFWRDTHVKIEGDAVKSMQLLFLLNWKFVSGQNLIEETGLFPDTTITEEKLVQIIGSGPDSDWSSIMNSFFAAINSAKKNIYISTPYFIPNDQIITSLQIAAMSGIDVKIILPANSDSNITGPATNSFIDELLRANVNVFLYEKGFIHAKILIVDDNFATVGTANMDYRSFDINFEINALIYDREITYRLTRDFNEDLANSRCLTIEEWDKRSHKTKFRESLARIMGPLL